MIDFVVIVEIIMDLIVFITVPLYIRCQFILYGMIKRGAKEKLSNYLYILYYIGYVNLLLIVHSIFFQILPIYMLQKFFYSFGSFGARIYFIIPSGGELFLDMCEAYIATSRYLTFIQNDFSKRYWDTRLIRKWLLAMAAVSVAYASSYFFCDFVTTYDADTKTVHFLYALGTLDWVTASIFVPFAVAMVSFFCCTYCYWKAATIIKGSQTKLTRTMVMKMCLSSAIISFGALISLSARIMNHVSYLVDNYDILPFPIFYLIVRVGVLISICGNPWILIALFPTVRQKVFPFWKKSSETPVVVSTIGTKPQHLSTTLTNID